MSSRSDFSSENKENKENTLPDSVANFFQTTKSLLGEEEEKIIKEYIQQNAWAIRDAQQKGSLLKLSKEATLIRETNGKVRVIPPGAPKEEKMIPLSHGILMYVDQNKDIEGAVLPKTSQDHSDEINLLLGKGAFGKVKACPTIFKNKIVAVKTQPKEPVMTGVEFTVKNEPETTKILGGETYIGSGERLSKKSKPKNVIIMDIFKDELATVSPGAPVPRGTVLKGKKNTDFKKLLILAISASQHLEHIHKQGYVHRDINASNIMLTGNGEARLVDFGLAINMREIPTKKTDSGINFFEDPGVIVGVDNFLAPEIKASRRYSDRSDIYALGVVFSDYLCLPRFAPQELREDIDNFVSRMKVENINMRQAAADVHLFLKEILQKLYLLEIKKIEEIKEPESTSAVSKETLKHFMGIINEKISGVELKEDNGSLQIIMSEPDYRLRSKILKRLTELAREPDGTRLLSVDYEIAGNVMTVKSGWINEMSKVFTEYEKNVTPDPLAEDSTPKLSFKM